MTLVEIIELGVSVRLYTHMKRIDGEYVFPYLWEAEWRDKKAECKWEGCKCCTGNEKGNV